MTKEKIDLAEDLAEEVNGGVSEETYCTDSKKVFKAYRDNVASNCTMRSKFIRNTASSLIPEKVKKDLGKI